MAPSRGCRLTLFPRLWIICRRSLFDLSRRERSQPWLGWQRMIGGRERRKSRVVDRPSRSLGRGKMYSIRSSWVCIKVLSTRSCRISSARPSIAPLRSKLTTKPNSRHKLSISLSTKSRQKRTSQKCSSKTSSHLSSFQTYKESRYKSNCNSRRRSSWKLQRRPSKKLLPILDRSWTTSRLWIWINERKREGSSREILSKQFIIYMVRINPLIDIITNLTFR